MGVINPMLHHNESEWATERSEAFDDQARGPSSVIWIIIAVLAVILGALIYYGYRTVKTQDLRITHIFGNQGALTSLGQRADAAESKLQDLTGNWQGMAQRVTKLEGRVTADFSESRKYAETLTQRLHQQITAEMDARGSTVDARLSQIESEEAAQRAQMAQVEQSLKQDLSAAREESGRDLSSVRQQEESNARGVSALSQKLDRQRVDFELAKGQTKELMPGISLKIGGVNVSHQRYHGTLHLTPDQGTVWLRDQSAQQPVRFYHADGREPYELVVTNVTKKAVAGYLLAPAKSESASSGTGELVGQNAQAEHSARE